MAYSRATTKFNAYTPSGLAAYLSAIIAGMTANASFPVPSPSLATLTTLLGDLTAAIVAWGPVGARGSHQDYLTLRAAIKAVQVALRAEAQYVNSIAAGDAVIAGSSGFTVTNPHTVIGVLSAPQNARQLVSIRTLPNEAILKWKKPLNIGFGKAGGYVVQWDNSGTWEQLALVSRTKATISNPVAPTGVSISVRIFAFNSAGNGTPCAPFGVLFMNL